MQLQGQEAAGHLFVRHKDRAGPRPHASLNTVQRKRSPRLRSRRRRGTDSRGRPRHCPARLSQQPSTQKQLRALCTQRVMHSQVLAPQGRLANPEDLQRQAHDLQSTICIRCAERTLIRDTRGGRENKLFFFFFFFPQGRKRADKQQDIPIRQEQARRQSKMRSPNPTRAPELKHSTSSRDCQQDTRGKAAEQRRRPHAEQGSISHKAGALVTRNEVLLLFLPALTWQASPSAAVSAGN